MTAPSFTAASGAAGVKPLSPPRTARVAVLGASGYSGQEFARLALAHPGLEIAALVSREHAGRPGVELLHGIDGRGLALPNVVAPDALAALVASGACDTIVACLPHGAWKALLATTPALLGAARLLDLSSDHRDGADGWVYGLPEVSRDGIAEATKLANPGCYPTAATLALAPAAEAGLLAGPVTVSAISASRAPGARRSSAPRSPNSTAARRSTRSAPCTRTRARCSATSRAWARRRARSRLRPSSCR